MWDVLSYDFKKNITKKKLESNVIDKVKNGSIIVFHDNKRSEKILKEKGYNLYPSSTMGSVQAIIKEGEYFYGAADPRRPGSGAVAP